MNSLKLKLVIIACAMMNTANSFTSTNNSKKNEKKLVEIEKTVSDKNENNDEKNGNKASKNVENEIEEKIEEEPKSPTKYNQRDDNSIDIKALVHEETPDYRIVNGNNVRLILKTKNNDVYSAKIVYSGGEKMMRSIGNYGGNEIFAAEIPNTVREYYFKLVDGKVRYFYGKNTTTSESSVQKFQYKKSEKLTYIPEWARGSVGYQIYIDSFRNGNVDNDPIFNEFGTDDFAPPEGEIRSGTRKKDLVAAEWGTTPYSFSVNEWNGNYETKNEWEENALNDVQNYTRYYGGDLQGIKEKLDYLKELGVEYIIISSPFYSLSNHKYDTIYFNHVDPYFGYIEQTGTNKGLDIKGKVHNNNGDKELNLLIFNPGTKKNLLDENLTDTATWVWTDSDLEFASLMKEAHKKGLKVVLEVAPDTVSTKFFAGTNSDYKKWYKNGENTKLDLSSKAAKEYVENSLKKWVLGPDETFKENVYDDGIDGIRYVYYDSKNKQHLVEITENLKKFKKDLLIVGEFSRNFADDIDAGLYDSGTDYNIVNNMIKYTINSNSNYRIGSVEFATKMNEIYNKYSSDRFNLTQIYIDSLDTDRIFSGIINPNRVFDRNNQSNQGYLNIRPDLYDENAISKLKRIIAVQLTMPATPVIYYGDEKGMWGSDSPRNRKPMLWDDYEPYEDETDDLSKYDINVLRNLPPEIIQINEVQKTVSYPVKGNAEIENFYRTLLKVRSENKELFKNGKFRVLEVYNDPKTKGRIDAEIQQYLNEEKRKAKTYQNKDINPQRPNTDFLSYEVSDGNKSMIVIINNSGDSYPVSLQVPKLFGFYENQLNKKEVYSISDKKISVILKPNEVKVLYSNDKSIFDSFKK